MRELQTKDVFVALRLFRAMNMESTLNRLSKATINDVEGLGAFIISEVLNGVSNPEAEKYFYEFVGGVLEIPTKEVETMNPIELLERTKELKTIINNDDWKGFFKSVIALLK